MKLEDAIYPASRITNLQETLDKLYRPAIRTQLRRCLSEKDVINLISAIGRLQRFYLDRLEGK